MPAYSSDDNILFTKLLTLFRENPKHGIPARQGLVVSFNPETGTPIAVSINFTKRFDLYGEKVGWQ